MENNKFTREIICFDLETTGLSSKDCGIVQFAALILDQDLNVIEEHNVLINPGDVVWNQSAIEVHGITKEKVKGCKTFVERAKYIFNLFNNRDILTHNGNVFDIQFLYDKLSNVNDDYTLRLGDVNVFDTLYIETKISSRKLGELFKKYTGETMEDAGLSAHDALSDVKATLSIFKKQMTLTDIFSMGAKLSTHKSLKYVGGVKCLSYGKYKHEPVESIIRQDPEYITWLVKSTGSKSLFKEIKEVYDSMN